MCCIYSDHKITVFDCLIYNIDSLMEVDGTWIVVLKTSRNTFACLNSDFVHDRAIQHRMQFLNLFSINKIFLTQLRCQGTAKIYMILKLSVTFDCPVLLMVSSSWVLQSVSHITSHHISLPQCKATALWSGVPFYTIILLMLFYLQYKTTALELISFLYCILCQIS